MEAGNVLRASCLCLCPTNRLSKLVIISGLQPLRFKKAVSDPLRLNEFPPRWLVCRYPFRHTWEERRKGAVCEEERGTSGQNKSFPLTVVTCHLDAYVMFWSTVAHASKFFFQELLTVHFRQKQWLWTHCSNTEQEPSNDHSMKIRKNHGAKVVAWTGCGSLYPTFPHTHTHKTHPMW